MSSKSKTQSPKLPFVFSNFAITADGKIAFADHTFTPFSSERDREHMMELRASADAVICGSRTINETDSILGTGGTKYRRRRLAKGLSEYNLRVVVSGSGSIDPRSQIFKRGLSPVIVLTTKRISAARLKKLRALADEVKIFGEREVNFRAALVWLRNQWKVKRLLCEGGGELHGALMDADLVDELHLTICPKIFGGRTAPTIADGAGVDHLVEAKRFELRSYQRMGDEVFSIWNRQPSR
ncbi:MAG TPA: RibD family protein [Verrucomicrobiae bacterium]